MGEGQPVAPDVKVAVAPAVAVLLPGCVDITGALVDMRADSSRPNVNTLIEYGAKLALNVEDTELIVLDVISGQPVAINGLAALSLALP